MTLDIKKWTSLLNESQWSELGNYLDEEIVYFDPFCIQEEKGLLNAAKLFGVQHSILKNSKYELKLFLQEGDNAAIEFRRFGNKISWENKLFDVGYDFMEGVFLTIKNGKISSYRRYFDLGQVFRLLENAVEETTPESGKKEG